MSGATWPRFEVLAPVHPESSFLACRICEGDSDAGVIAQPRVRFVPDRHRPQPCRETGGHEHEVVLVRVLRLVCEIGANFALEGRADRLDEASFGRALPERGRVWIALTRIIEILVPVAGQD